MTWALEVEQRLRNAEQEFGAAYYAKLEADKRYEKALQRIGIAHEVRSRMKAQHFVVDTSPPTELTLCP